MITTTSHRLGRGTEDVAAFRNAMARFPSGVTIVTTYDESGDPCGFTASSFCSVSAAPPLVLVCLARSARSFPVFSRTDRFAVSVLGSDQADLAVRFATRGADKFGAGGFVDTSTGAVVVDRALAGLECVKESQHFAGDHLIIVGRVQSVLLPDDGTRPPAVYVDRAFARLATGTEG
jgi:flavin reductase ActVB